MAEREGFEPSVEFPLHTLSKRAPSTTRTSLRVSGINSLPDGGEPLNRRLRRELWVRVCGAGGPVLVFAIFVRPASTGRVAACFRSAPW